MNWRDGRPSLWGDTIRQGAIDHDGELEALRMIKVMVDAQASLLEERIALLERDKARSMLTLDHVATAPARA